MEDYRAKYEKLKSKLDNANKEIDILQESKKSFQKITRYLDDFVWIMDQNNEVVYVSPSIEKAFGITEDKISTKFLLNLISPDIRVFLEQEISLRLVGKASDDQKQWVSQIKDKDNNALWIDIVINPIITDKGQFDGVMGIARDITKQKETENALRKSEEEFRTIFENTDSAISIQTDKQILLVNKAWEQITGYTLQEAKTLSPIDLIHPADRDQTFANTLKRLRGECIESNYQFHLVGKRYNEKWINNSATLIDYNGEKAILVIGNDITDRKNTENELNKLSTGIINSPLSIVITDIDGTIEYVNPFFTEVTGYTSEEAIGENPKILSSGRNSKDIYEDLWSTILNGKVWKGEFENKTKSGKVYWESARIAPIVDNSGIITNFIAIKEDVTDRKLAFEIVEQSEKYLREVNAKKDKFFSIISHDLRSPFSGIIGLVDILKTSYKELDDNKIGEYLDLIHNSAKNTFKLLENLLSWAKSQTGKMSFNPKSINLSQLVNEVVSVVSISAKNKSIDIEVNVDENDIVFADEDMLNTILRNLITNALKYTNHNGVIKILYKTKEFENKLYSVVGVEDNGVGISKENQSKMFKIEGNYTTAGTEREKGTGLGLILCKEFIEKHDGRIWCKSEEDKGSIFYFSLPNEL